jgi:hypothetical protein
MAREPRFGERVGAVAPKALQLDSVDESLRMAIWNHVYRHLLVHRPYESPTAADRAALFYEFLRWDLAEFTQLKVATERLQMHVVHWAKWWHVYEFLECALRLRTGSTRVNRTTREQREVLWPVIPADVRVMLRHRLRRVPEHPDQVVERSSVQAPVAGERVPQTVKMDHVHVRAALRRSLEPSAVETAVEHFLKDAS